MLRLKFFGLVWLCALLASTSTKACKVLQNGGPVTASLTKRTPSDVPICLILNDRYLFSTQLTFDTYTRIVLPGSFKAVTAADACKQDNSVWFPTPLQCSWKDGTYGEGIGFGAPSNYYVSVQGISSNYRKRYAVVSTNGPPTTAPTTTAAVTGVIPIVTLVISVENGIVKDVYWDDNCYFNYARTFGTTSGADQMDCLFNAYQIDNKFTARKNSTFNAFLNSNSKNSLTGYDTMISVDACKTNTWKDPATSSSQATNVALPDGFCDLGIYVTWVGTSADGQQLASASPRFKRFRDYAMLSEYPTVSENFCPEHYQYI